jgi:hypothetical protein
VVALINVISAEVSLQAVFRQPRKDPVAYVSLSSYSHVKEQFVPQQNEIGICTASRFANLLGRDGQRLHCRDAETQPLRQLTVAEPPSSMDADIDPAILPVNTQSRFFAF